MQKLPKNSPKLAEWIGAFSPVPREFPTAILVFGVLANFAWLAVVFWFLSYWIVWH